MDSINFKKYLLNLQLSFNGSNARVKACEQIEKKLKVNLDIIVADVITFKEFLPILRKIETKRQKYQNALIHYFNFRHPGKKVVFHISYGDSILLKDLGNIIFDINRAIITMSINQSGIKKYVDNTEVVKCEAGSLVLEVIIGSVISACFEIIIDQLIQIIKKHLNKNKTNKWNIAYSKNIIKIEKANILNINK